MSKPKTGLILRVREITGTKWILLDEFKFASNNTRFKAPDFDPRRFLRCMNCGLDEFVELTVNYLECSNCDEKIDIITKA